MRGSYGACQAFVNLRTVKGFRFPIVVTPPGRTGLALISPAERQLERNRDTSDLRGVRIDLDHLPT
jgi:hypothetical protein